MNNWKDYIDQKFIPKEEFEFENKNWKKGIYILITHKRTGTWFKIYDPSDEWRLLGNIEFGNKDESFGFWDWDGNIPFLQGEVKLTDEFLKPAFLDGISYKKYYLFNKHYKSIVYGNKNFSRRIYSYYISNFIGCTWLLYFPIIFILNSMVRLKLIGGIKEKVVEPIKSSE